MAPRSFEYFEAIIRGGLKLTFGVSQHNEGMLFLDRRAYEKL